MPKLGCIILLLFSVIGHAQDNVTSSAVSSWLNLVDQGKYAESWQATDAFFKSQVSQNQWQQALENVRAPLGAVVSRTSLNSQQTSNLPGVAEGDYLVAQYQTEFKNKHGAVETITLSKQSGKWKVIGYFVK